VRHWRDRVAPASVGLAQGRRRRATGLRREEVAELAGISVDYLTRLEQGRATSPSAQVVEALARALRVSDAERDLLFRLAGHTPPGLDLVSSRITPSVQRLLDRLANTPVAVYDATWTLIVANAPYDALMGQTTNWRGIERNSIWRHLVGPGNRAVQTPEERADSAAALKSATGVIRSEVGRLIGLRHTPSLEFISDDLPENAQRIDELVLAARQKDEELARAAEGAQWAGDPDPYKKPEEDWSEDDEDDEDDDTD